MRICKPPPPPPTPPPPPPWLHAGFGSRGQVDLIDFQSCPDNEFKYLLNYQDHGIKLYDCRPLKDKRAQTIAFALLDIFTVYGAPAVLQCDNGREFSGIASEPGKSTDPLSDEVCAMRPPVPPPPKTTWMVPHPRSSSTGSPGEHRACVEKGVARFAARLSAWYGEQSDSD